VTDAENNPVDLPGSGGQRDPIVRRPKKGAGQTPKRAFLIMGVAAVAMAVVLGFSWIQAMSPKTVERARTAPVAASVENRGISATEEPTPAYLELVQEENRRAVEAAASGDMRAVIPPLIGERTSDRGRDPVVSFDDAPVTAAPRAAAARSAAPDPKRAQAIVAESRRLLAHTSALAPSAAVEGAPLLIQRSGDVSGALDASATLDAPHVPLFVVQSAVLETGANSDYPAPVIMRVTSGPLKGARVVGEFSASASQGVSDRIQLRASKIEVDGVVYTTDGLAVDPAARIPAIEGDINRHLARNILARGSVAFLLGYAGGVTSGATRTSFSAEGGLIGSTIRTGDLFRAEAAREAASAASEVRIRQPTVTVPAGTPIGLVFLDRLKSTDRSSDRASPYVAGAPVPDNPVGRPADRPLEFSTPEYQ